MAKKKNQYTVTQSDDNDILTDSFWSDIDMNSIQISEITGSSETITITDYADSFTADTFSLGGLDTITIGDVDFKSTVTIGNITLTEEKIETYEALIEAIRNLPEDNELRTMFESVLILKKLKHEN